MEHAILGNTMKIKNMAKAPLFILMDPNMKVNWIFSNIHTVVEFLIVMG